MKNKKSLLSLGIFALVLVLGVGYAAISGIELNINGTATVYNKEIEVYFTEVAEETSVDNNVSVKAAGTVTGEKTATITVTDLEVVGDWASVTYTVENANKDLEAVIEASVVSIENENDKDLSEFYKVTFNPQTVTIDAAADLETPASTEITVKVELIKVPIEVEDSAANIAVKLDVTPVQPGQGSN